MDLKSSGRARRSSWREWGVTYKLYVITPTHIPSSLIYIYIFRIILRLLHFMYWLVFFLFIEKNVIVVWLCVYIFNSQISWSFTLPFKNLVTVYCIKIVSKSIKNCTHMIKIIEN